MLDRFQLISNSDAHSPAKLGREATLLDIDWSYEGLRGAIQNTLLDIDWSYEGLRGAIQNGSGLAGTIEFFPEEGKYHMDGHRKCNLCLTPMETETYQAAVWQAPLNFSRRKENTIWMGIGSAIFV